MAVDRVEANLKKCITLIRAVLTASEMFLFPSEKVNIEQEGEQNRFCTRVGDNQPGSSCITCPLIASCNKSTLFCVPSSIKSAPVKSGKFKKNHYSAVNSKNCISALRGVHGSFY